MSDDAAPSAVHSQAIAEAADGIVDRLLQHYRDSRGVHAETAIAAAAALTGEWALRASAVRLPDVGWIVADAIDNLTMSDPDSAWNAISAGAIRAGLPKHLLPQPAAVAARTVSAFGTASYPPLTVPRVNLPREWPPLAAASLREPINEIARNNGLSPKETMQACAAATALLIERTSVALSTSVGTVLALEVMMGVARMVPISASTGTNEGAGGAE